MNKISKIYLLAFVFSLLSLAAAVVLKLCGITWFDSTIKESTHSTSEYILQAAVLIVQGFLMLGCMTWISPKELVKKYLPFVPLNVLPLLLPSSYALCISFSVFVAMAFLARPKLTTSIRFFTALIYISLIQQASVWVKYGLFHFKTIEADAMTVLVGNIDQFILFALYYYVAWKWGGKIVELVLFWKNRPR